MLIGKYFQVGAQPVQHSQLAECDTDTTADMDEGSVVCAKITAINKFSKATKFSSSCKQLQAPKIFPTSLWSRTDRCPRLSSNNLESTSPHINLRMTLLNPVSIQPLDNAERDRSGMDRSYFMALQVSAAKSDSGTSQLSRLEKLSSEREISSIPVISPDLYFKSSQGFSGISW